jgi:hypothetical protein
VRGRAPLIHTAMRAVRLRFLPGRPSIFGPISAIVAIGQAFWHTKRAGGHPAAGSNGCGCSSGVEHDLAKVGVEGSNPFARSKT